MVVNELFIAGGLAEMLVNRINEFSGEYTQREKRLFLTRMLEMSDHIDQMESAINALEKRIKKLEKENGNIKPKSESINIP